MIKRRIKGDKLKKLIASVTILGAFAIGIICNPVNTHAYTEDTETRILYTSNYNDLGTRLYDVSYTGTYYSYTYSIPLHNDVQGYRDGMLLMNYDTDYTLSFQVEKELQGQRLASTRILLRASGDTLVVNQNGVSNNHNFSLQNYDGRYCNFSITEQQYNESSYIDVTIMWVTPRMTNSDGSTFYPELDYFKIMINEGSVPMEYEPTWIKLYTEYSITWVKKEAFDEGYNLGYYNAPPSDHAELYNMVLAVVDAPISIFRNIFNFEILGVNLSNFVMSLMTVVVIAWLIKRLL